MNTVPFSLHWLFLLITVLANTAVERTVAEQQLQQYNEVQYRVLEAVKNLMNPPVLALKLMKELYQIQAFRYGLEAPDRDKAMEYMYSIIQAQNDTGVRVYYGMESGLFLGYTASTHDQVPTLSYREPGESGYDPIQEMQQYWNICVDEETGDKQTCQMERGSTYISCRNSSNCQTLVKCPDPDSQRNCSDLPTNEEIFDCERNIKWCKDYSIHEWDDSSTTNSTRRGYIPRAYSCINSRGSFSKAPGEALLEVFNETTNSVTVELGDCTYANGAMVTRKITGPYAYCQQNGHTNTCTTYTGVYRTREYDPRYRTWYRDVQTTQRSLWTDPYLFFSKEELGITYAEPVFNTDEMGRNMFMGVLAADYFLTDITNLLVQAYQYTNLIVGIYEHAEPHYIIGLSTSGTQLSKRVLSQNHSQPCLIQEEDIFFDVEEQCDVIRISVTELEGTEAEILIKKAHFAFVNKEEGHASDENIVVQMAPTNSQDQESLDYWASSLIYEHHPNSNLKWRIVVLQRVEIHLDWYNAVTKQDGLFGVICTISITGFLLCLGLFFAFLSKRKEKTVKFADIRFTSAFIFNCALLNLSYITFLGENTDNLCLLRIWCFYLLLSMAFSPLLVKAYRTWLLLDATRAKKRRKMTNLQTLFRTLPIVLVQLCILLLTTFLDPPIAVKESAVFENTIPVQETVCRQQTHAFLISQGVFYAYLISLGCFLSYKTRNFHSKISDSLPLLFAMYNVAFTVLMGICIIALADLSVRGQIVLHSIAIFAGTVFSSAAFVIPRLMIVNSEQRERQLKMTRARQILYSKRLNELRYKRRSNRVSDVESAYTSNDLTESDLENACLDVLVCTANMGNAQPTLESMAAWIPKCGLCDYVTPLEGISFDSVRFDLIVIGMQEATWSSGEDISKRQDNKKGPSLKRRRGKKSRSVLASITKLMVDNDDDDNSTLNYLAAVEGADTVALREMIKQLLGDSYVSVAEESRGEMRLYIYALTDVAPFVEDIKISGANTGVGNVLANKGGICISFNCMKTRFNFLSAHLAAHEGQSHYQARCENIHDILKSSQSAKFGQPYYDSSIFSHHMFVLGDLNFRTLFADNASHEENVKRAMKLIEQKDFGTLYSFDELHHGIANGDLLVQFETLPCNFHPTFKVERGPGFVYKEQRTPSYTDRILFKSAWGLGSKLKPMAYEPCVDFITSDHKPVRGAFTITPNDIIKPSNVEGRLQFRFHEMSGCDLHVGDFDGFSDPYIMIVWDGVDIKREDENGLKKYLPEMLRGESWPRIYHERKTLNPSWTGKEISLALEAGLVGADAMMFVVVMDYDFGKKDDWLGTLPLSVTQLIAMMDGEKKKQISFDELLPHDGKAQGRIRFKLDMSID